MKEVSNNGGLKAGLRQSLSNTSKLIQRIGGACFLSASLISKTSIEEICIERYGYEEKERGKHAGTRKGAEKV